MIARILFYIIIVYVVMLIVMYFMQRHLQYYPNKSYPGTPAENDVPEMKDIRVKTEDGFDLLAWFSPPKEDPEGNIVVFFHGNAGHIGHRAVKARYFIDKGYGVFFCEYRGFGGNAGWPSEKGFYTDARACLQWLEKEGYKGRQFILYGESIGSGVATQMAVEMQPKIVILEAPFTSAADVAKRTYFYLPVDWLMKDRFDNIKKIKHIKSKVLIVHGDEDGVIPIALAEKLFAAANHPKELITINGGAHNNLYEHHAGHVISEWLENNLETGK